MTTTHDLSLLTDEERALYERLAEGLPESAKMFANALIAARAELNRREGELKECADAFTIKVTENKRKDEVIAKLIDAAEQGRSLLRQMAEVSSLAGRRGAHERADAIDAVLKDAAALLQSEKGVNMPKVTGEVCPKCLSLTHFEDIELPSYRVLGVPEPPEYKRIEVCPECGWQSEKGGE